MGSQWWYRSRCTCLCLGTLLVSSRVLLAPHSKGRGYTQHKLPQFRTLYCTVYLSHSLTKVTPLYLPAVGRVFHLTSFIGAIFTPGVGSGSASANCDLNRIEFISVMKYLVPNLVFVEWAPCRTVSLIDIKENFYFKTRNIKQRLETVQRFRLSAPCWFRN